MIIPVDNMLNTYENVDDIIYSQMITLNVNIDVIIQPEENG
jgi:hypothetical protein